MNLPIEPQAHGLGGPVGTPRAIAALRTDGGTKFTLRCDRSSWLPAFQRLVSELQRPRSQDEEAKERRNKIYRMVPLPSTPDCLPLEQGERLDPRLLGWGYSDTPPYAEVQVSGRHREYLVFYFEDRAHVTLREVVDEEGVCSWECRVEAKARELYADGLRLWMVRWLGLWGWLLTGKWSMPETSEADGWNTTQWHLNSDFACVDIAEGDQRMFTTARKGRVQGNPSDESMERAGLFPSPDPSKKGSYTAYEFPLVGPWMQTVELGRKTSDCALVIYRKGDQLREAKKVNPACSMYAPLWRINGWDPDVDGDPLRVEFRLRKKGLQYRCGEDKGQVAYDFRNPALLLDDHAVASLWAYLTTKRRLVIPDHDKKRICSTDPRWMVVQEAAGVRPPDIRQLPRKVREMTREERIAKDLRSAVSAAIAYAARFGVAAFSPEAIGDVLIAMGHAIKRGDIEIVERVLDHRLDLKAAVDRARMSTDFFAHQADDAYGELAAMMGYWPKRLYDGKHPLPPPPIPPEVIH